MARRANDDGSVFKRSDRRSKPWVAAYHVVAPSGRRVRKCAYFATRREAKDALEAARLAVADGLPVPDARLTFGGVLDTWLAGRRMAVAPSTFLSYQGIVETWLRPRLGAERMRTLGPEPIERVLAEVAATRSPRRVRAVRETARAVCAFALRRGLLGRNPVLLVDLPSDRSRVEALGAEEAAARRTFTTEQVAILLDDTRDDRLWPLWVSAATLGARQGELFALTWSDVDLPGRSLTIRRSLGVDLDGHPAMQVPKTRGSHRTIQLPFITADALRVHAERQAEEREAAPAWADLGLVFANGRGRPLDPRNVLREFQAALARSNLPVLRFHDLRHYCATEALASGIPAHEVARYLGHASPSTTLQLYAHVTPRGASRTAEAFDRALGSGVVEVRA